MHVSTFDREEGGTVVPLSLGMGNWGPAAGGIPQWWLPAAVGALTPGVKAIVASAVHASRPEVTARLKHALLFAYSPVAPRGDVEVSVQDMSLASLAL